MGKKKKCPVGTPGWMATFADMNTLLLTFFVLLVSTMTIDIKKFNLVLSAFKGAVGVLEQGRTINLTREELMNSGQKPERLAKQDDITRPRQEVQQVLGWISQSSDRQEIQAEVTERGLKILLTDKVLFGPGSAELSTRGANLISEIANNFLKVVVPDDNIRIEGYTDDLPQEGSAFRSNLELSAARAASVYYLLEKMGIVKKRMSIAGYGDQRSMPRRDNETIEDWRNRNRRVEIVVIWKEGAGA